MVRGSAPLCGVFLRLFGGTAGRVRLIPSERKQKMNDTFMKTRPVLPLLVSMALPNVISMLVNSLYNIVDSYFVARISENAMTALSLVYPLQILINAVAVGLGIGLNATASFYLGAQEHEKANDSASVGMILSIIHGLILTLVCILIVPHFLRLFTQDEAVISYALTYSYIVFCISSFEQNRIISKFSLNLKLSLNPSISCLLHTFHIFSLYIPPNPNLSNSTYLLYFILTDSHIRFYHISIIKIFGDFSPDASNVSLAKGKVNKLYWENTKKNYKKSGATTPI